MKIQQNQNYRTRVAAERRERTRMKLLHSALHVISEKGSQAVIGDVIAEAGVARGSFYNYFKTYDDLLIAVANEINNELLRAIDPIVQCFSKPIERISCGTRMLLHAVEGLPQFASFIAHMTIPTAETNLLGLCFLERDLELGWKSEQFLCDQQRVAMDLIIGIIFHGIYSLANEVAPPDYPESLVKVMLVGLGVTELEAARIVTQTLPDLVLPPTSILLIS